jgi:hypothetical protein
MMDIAAFPLQRTGDPKKRIFGCSKHRKFWGTVLLSLRLAGQLQGRMSVLLHRDCFPAFDDQVVSPSCYRQSMVCRGQQQWEMSIGKIVTDEWLIGGRAMEKSSEIAVQVS